MFEGLILSAGLGMHSERLDSPEVQGIDNPVGIVRVHKKSGRLEMYCEHISSIPIWERGHGFNHCGVLVRFND